MGHQKLIWAGTGNWDFAEAKVINFSRAFFFEGELTPLVLTMNQVVEQYMPLKLRENEILAFTQNAKKLMGRYEFQFLTEQKVKVSKIWQSPK